jgi:excisionase family DNA binding protein
MTSERILLTVSEAALALNLGRTFAYQLIARGELVSIKIGKRRLIPATVVQEYVQRQLAEQSGHADGHHATA